jgi:hypothetical protein
LEGTEVDEPVAVERLRHLLQRPVHPPVERDLVVERPEDAGDAALSRHLTPKTCLGLG